MTYNANNIVKKQYERDSFFAVARGERTLWSVHILCQPILCVFILCKNLREIRKTESLKIPTCNARPLLKVAIFIFATIVFKTRRYCIAQAPLTAVATHCFSILCILSPAIITILGFIIATCLECAQSCCLNYRVYQIC